MKRNAFTSFVTDSGNKTIPLPPYSCSFITFWGFFNGKSIPFVMKNDFQIVTMFIPSSPFMSKVNV